MPPIISWLKGLGLGLRFEPQPIYLLTQDTTRIAGKGGGLAIFETLRDKALPSAEKSATTQPLWACSATRKALLAGWKW